MKYVIMECHTSYAVVLTEDGRFLNVANMHYQVGQSVDDVFAMELIPVPAKKRKRRWIIALIAIALCFILLFAGIIQYSRLPYGSVYISINPTVRIDVKKNNEVINVDGMNYDGVQLLEGYSYDDKYLDMVAEELLDRAVDMGYLSDGDEIRLTMDADDDDWEIYKGNMLKSSINEYINEKLTVYVRLSDDDDDSSDDDDFDYDDDD